MRCFHDLLRQKPSPLFILLGRSSIWMTSLTILLGLSGEDGSIMKLNAVSKLTLWSAVGDSLDAQDGCSADAPSTSCSQNSLSAKCRPCRTNRGFYINPASLVPGYLWPAGGNYRYFLGKQAHWFYVILGQYFADSVWIESRHRAGSWLSLDYRRADWCSDGWGL
jgi:hypothetical protein